MQQSSSLLESKVKINLRKFCKNNNILLIPYPQNGMGMTGFPDYLAYTNDKHFVIECKATGKNLRESQYAVRKLLSLRNVQYFIYRGTSEDEQIIKDFI